jgi:hypothetical protein
VDQTKSFKRLAKISSTFIDVLSPSFTYEYQVPMNSYKIGCSDFTGLMG